MQRIFNLKLKDIFFFKFKIVSFKNIHELYVEENGNSIATLIKNNDHLNPFRMVVDFNFLFCLFVIETFKVNNINFKAKVSKRLYLL